MKQSTVLKYSLLLFSFSLLFSSCKTTKVYDPIYDEYDYINNAENKEDIQKEHDDKELKDLSLILGIDVVKTDNIALYKEVSNWLGVPYRYGGNNKKGVDCSGLICQIYLKVYDKKLYRSSADIYNKNCRKIKKGQLEAGDLIFFATGKNRSRINHVGIYLKDGKFAHSSSSRGVVVSDVDEKYYVRTYVSSGRVE